MVYLWSLYLEQTASECDLTVEIKIIRFTTKHTKITKFYLATNSTNKYEGSDLQSKVKNGTDCVD